MTAPGAVGLLAVVAAIPRWLIAVLAGHDGRHHLRGHARGVLAGRRVVCGGAR